MDKDDSAFPAGVRYRRLFLADPQVSREGRYRMRRVLCRCRAPRAFRLGPRFHRAPCFRVYPPGGLPDIRVPDSLYGLFSAESAKEVRRIRPAGGQEQPLLRVKNGKKCLLTPFLVFFSHFVIKCQNELLILGE